ncbi:hypothetical protein [Helicobacter japonicus]|nr:hypothetical protein [Helicobacter japonicus]
MMQEIAKSSESTQSVGRDIHKIATDMSCKAKDLESAISKFKT